MNNQYIIDELSKEAAYHINAYQEKVAALNSMIDTEKTAGIADAMASAKNFLVAQGTNIGNSLSSLGSDIKYTAEMLPKYLMGKGLGYPSTYMDNLMAAGRMLGRDITSHPLATSSALAAAGLGTAYGMGAFDGQPSPEAAGMMQGGMSPEEMLAAAEMAKQSSYNPQMYKTADYRDAANINRPGNAPFGAIPGVNSTYYGDVQSKADPSTLSKLRAYLSGKATDAWNYIGWPKAWEATKGFAGKHPWATGAAALAPAAIAAAAYGMGAFDGQPSPEGIDPSAMPQTEMSPEEMMMAAEMAKQGSYNPQMQKIAAGGVPGAMPGTIPGVNSTYYGSVGKVSPLPTDFEKLKYLLKDRAGDMWNATKKFVGKHPWLTAGAVLPPVALGAAGLGAAGLGTAYALGAFDGQQSPEAAGMMQEGMSPEEAGMMQGGMPSEEMMAAEMAKQSSYNPNIYADNEKLAAYNNLITTLQQNPEFKQILMNM